MKFRTHIRRTGQGSSRRSARGDRRPITRRRSVVAGAVALALVGVVAASRLLGRDPDTVASDDRPTVAVLPLRNVGTDPADRYLADGLLDELIADLAQLGAMRVIARPSVEEYRQSDVDPRAIGEELGADWVVDGSVRRTGGNVQVTLRLLETADSAVRTESFERPTTQLFAIRADVARRVAEAAGVRLPASVAARISRPATSAPRAHDLALRAGERVVRGDAATGASSEREWRAGLELYDDAIALDSSYSRAWAGRAAALLRLYRWRFDRTDSVRDAARYAAERAVSLDRAEPEAWRALAFSHFWGERQYDAALDAFASLRELQPGSAASYSGPAFVQRRLGRWRVAANTLARAVELSPRDPALRYELGRTYARLRDVDAATIAFDSAIALAPDRVAPYVEEATLYFQVRGDTVTADSIARLARRRCPPGDAALDLARYWSMRRGGADTELAVLRDAPTVVSSESAVRLRDLAFAGALDRAGRHAAAVEHYRAAERLLLRMPTAKSGDDFRIEIALAYALAGQGDRRALDHARRAVTLVPTTRDAMLAPDLDVMAAEVEAMLRDSDAAVDRLRRLRDRRVVTPAMFRLEPRWDSLRGDPRFDALEHG